VPSWPKQKNAERNSMKRCPHGATANLPNGTKVSTSKITVKDHAKIADLAFTDQSFSTSY
jgi:hypothetical protein